MSARLLAPPPLPGVAARRLVWAWLWLGLPGCLPDMADDAALAAHLAALQDDADTDAANGDDAADTGTLDTADGVDEVTDAGTDTGDTAHDSDDAAQDAGDAADVAETADGAGNLGASCANDAGCIAPADIAPCQRPICADGTCALTAADAGTPCEAKGLSLAACEETRCDDKGACKVTKASDGKSCNADDNGCTVGDICQGGFCSSGAVKICPAGEACAPQKCVSTGPADAICKPSFAGSGTECDDGDACTGGDVCDGGGVCAGTALACDASGACPTAPVCNDGNPCTDDVCQAGACAFLPTTAPCSDGDPCTTQDACDGQGACQPGVPRLFDKLDDLSSGAAVFDAVRLTGGGVVALGVSNSQPFRVQASALGEFGASQTGPDAGRFTRGLAMPDGGWIAGGDGKTTGKLSAPMLARFTSAGVQSWKTVLASEAGDGVETVALLPSASDDQLWVVARRPSGKVSDNRVVVFDLVQTKPTGATVSIGTAFDSRSIAGGVREPTEKRAVLAGRHEVAGKWAGHLYRLTDNLLFGGEVDVTKSAPARFIGVELAVGGGYLAYGAVESSSIGHDVAWVVRLDSNLKVQWEANYGGDLGTTAFDLAQAPWGDLNVVGFTSTGDGQADAAGVAWRLSPQGATLATTQFPSAGGVFSAVMALSDGYLIVGDYGLAANRKPRLLRTTPWMQASCADAGGCAALAAQACDDANACTVDACVAGGGCGQTPLAAGAPCGDGKTCDGKGVCQ